MIGRRGERGSGISVLAARHDDDHHQLTLEIEDIKEKLKNDGKKGFNMGTKKQDSG